MKYAWIENQVIRDICPKDDPYVCYTNEIAALYNTQVPDSAENGDGWVNGQVVPKPVPQPAPAPEPAPRKWTAEDFRKGMTLAEKVKWDSDTIPEIKTVKTELPKELAGATELLDFLVASNVISQETATKILG